MASSVTPKVPIICGIATLTMVRSMTETYVASITVAEISHILAVEYAAVCSAIVFSGCVLLNCRSRFFLL